jgi:hypothetical protein
MDLLEHHSVMYCITGEQYLASPYGNSSPHKRIFEYLWYRVSQAAVSDSGGHHCPVFANDGIKVPIYFRERIPEFRKDPAGHENHFH